MHGSLTHHQIIRSKTFCRGLYSYLIIKNEGNKPAENIAIPLNTDIHILAIITRDGISKTQEVKGSLNLDSLRPSGSVQIDIWSSSTALPYGEDATVSTSDGVLKIDRPTRISGIGRTIGNFANFCVENPFLTFWFGIIAFLLYIPLAISTAKLLGYEDKKPELSDSDNSNSEKKKKQKAKNS